MKLGLCMEVALLSEMSDNLNQATRRHNAEDIHQ